MADVGGRTTKRTYVTKYTTDVDPRTLPDFASRGVVTGEEEDGMHNGQQYHRQHQPHHHSQQLQPQHYGGSSGGWQEESHRAPRGQNGSAAAASAGGGGHTVTQRGPAPLPVPPQRHYAEDSPAYSASPASSVGDSAGGHRLRKKYTTTTVTTITTTTVLLPTMQEAYVFPSVTSHQMDQQAHGQPAIAGPQGRVYQIDSSHASSTSASPDRHRQLQTSSADRGRLVPSQPQYAPDGSAVQAWAFQQRTANNVTTQEGQSRLPTLEELGITSYFGKEDGRQHPQQQRRAAPYAAASQQSREDESQPWVATETRHEVEGGRRYY